MKVWVDSEGWARPPYSWSLSGTGFHFGNVSGPTTATTDEDLEGLELWADDTACGSGTITVTDVCGNTGTDYIRCTTGQWVLHSAWNSCPDPGGCHYCHNSCSDFFFKEKIGLDLSLQILTNATVVVQQLVQPLAENIQGFLHLRMPMGLVPEMI